MQQANGKKKKKERNDRVGLEKQTVQKTLFTSVLTIAREMPKKIKRKNPDKMCQLIFLKLYHSNRNNDTKILYIFAGNVKPYIQIHI